eukprot:931493_1
MCVLRGHMKKQEDIDIISIQNILFISKNDQSGETAILLQNYPNGALTHYLQQNRQLAKFTYSRTRSVFIWNCFADLFSALSTLWSIFYIHRDVTGGNILIDDQGMCVLSGFGQVILDLQAQADLAHASAEIRESVVIPGANIRPFEVQILYGREPERYTTWLSEHLEIIDIVDLINTMICAWNQLSPGVSPIPLCYDPKKDGVVELKEEWSITYEETVSHIGRQWMDVLETDTPGVKPKTIREVLIKFSVLAFHSGKITVDRFNMEISPRQMVEKFLTWEHLRECLANVEPKSDRM